MAKPTRKTLTGTSQNDMLILPAGWLLSNTNIDGGKGNDTLNLSGYASAGVTITLFNGSRVTEKAFTGSIADVRPADSTTVTGTIKNVENFIGTQGNDWIQLAETTVSGRLANGGAGNDFVQALGGNATEVGGTGSDWLTSNWLNNVLVGGTYTNGVAPGDDERDFFHLSSAPKILDFEVGADELIFERSMADIPAFEAANWVSDGAGGAKLIVNGVLAVTLTGVNVASAETIVFGYSVAPTNGRVEGAGGNDILHDQGGATITRFVVGQDSGHDITASGFDVGSDILVFEDGVAPVWSNTMINGAAALVGVFQGGSITLPGLSTSDVPSLLMEGLGAGVPVYGSAGMSHWSSASDAPFFI